jgi:hypothetical protein
MPSISRVPDNTYVHDSIGFALWSRNCILKIANSICKSEGTKSDQIWSRLSPEEGLSRETDSSNLDGGNDGCRNGSGADFHVGAGRDIDAVANLRASE